MKKMQKYQAIIVGLFMITSGVAFLVSLPVMGANNSQPKANGSSTVIYGDAPPEYVPHTVPRCVLMEDNTNWGCGPCTGHNVNWAACIEANGYDTVAPVFMHVHWPAGTDPWNQYNDMYTWANGRRSQEGCTYVPWPMVDGSWIQYSQSQAFYQAEVDSRLAVESRVSITSTGALDSPVPDEGYLNVRVTATDDLPAADWRVMFELWEDEVTRYGTGPNGETHYDWAAWLFLDDDGDNLNNHQGVSVWSGGATAGQYVDINYNFNMETEWERDFMGATVFLQDFSQIGGGESSPYSVEQAHANTFDFINTPPTVEVLDNNGQGEDGTWASTQTVTWLATDPDQPAGELDVMVEVSSNGGGSWTIIENGVDNNDGMCTWDTTTGPDSTDYLVRVSVWDDYVMLPVQDVSDTVFEVSNMPTIDLTSPDGGEAYMGGSAQNIQWDMWDFWTPHNQLVVDLYYSTDGGATYPNTIAMGLTGFPASPCTYNWDPIPLLDNTQMRVLAEVTDTDGLDNNDNSVGNFEIDSTAPAPASNVYCELDGTGVRIFWDPSPSPDVNHYEVWWRMNAFDATGASYVSSINAGTNTDVLHAAVGANNPQSYTYQVRTYDGVGHETMTIIQGAKYGSTQSTLAREPDWFLLGNPLSQMDDTLGAVIQGSGLPANYDCIRTYNGMSDFWLTQIPASPITGITNLPTNQGFWMHITTSTRFCTVGYVEDKVINLYDGWNFVAYPFATRSMNTAAIQSHLTTYCPGYGGMLIEDVNMPYHLKTPAGTENILHNQGFFLYVSGDTTWTVTNY
jgi:hypothetical protein